jgi:hypothetical protein
MAAAMLIPLTAGTAVAGRADTYVKSNRLFADVPACGAIGCPYGPAYVVRDGSHFSMRCWQSGPWRQTHYAYDGSSVWFQGSVAGYGLIWVHSSYVFNQIRVGPC